MKQVSLSHRKYFLGYRALGLIFIGITLIGNVFGEQRTATVSGFWSSTATWGGSAVPTNADDVIIRGNINVTIDNTTAACANLSINPNDNNTGTLTFNNSTILTVAGNLTIGGSGNAVGSMDMSSGGTLRMGGLFTISNLGTTYKPGTGTIEYNGTAQTVLSAFSYNHLVLSGAGTKTLNGATKVNGTLTIHSNCSLSTSTSNYDLTLNGDFNNSGTFFTAGASNIRITGASNQTIAGFQTTGTVYMLKTNGAATFTGNVNAGALTMNGSGGTLNLGTNLTHTFKGTITRSYGTLNVGSSTLKLGGDLSGTGGAFNPGTGTVEYNGSAQTVISIAPRDYYHLILSGSGIKTFQTGTTSITGNLTLSGTASATTVTGLTIGGNLIMGDGTAFTIGGFPFTVNGNTTVGGGTSGNLTISSATGVKLFAGLLTISKGATWNNSGNSPVEFRGGIAATPSFTGGAGLHTFSTNAQFLSGTFSIPNITVSGVTLTNQNLLSVATALSGTGGLTQGPNSSLMIGGTSGISNLTATATGNTVNYTGSGQTLKSTTYHHLALSNTTGTQTAGGPLIVNGALITSAGGTLDMGTYQLLGTLATIDHNGVLQTRNTTSTPIPHDKTWGGTITYAASGTQTIAPGSYYNLTLSGSGTKTIHSSCSVTVNGCLATNDLLAINSDATNSGSLIVHGTSAGNVTYNCWLDHTGDTFSRWYITSAPVNVLSGFEANTSKIHSSPNPLALVDDYDFATYDESANDWTYFPTTSPLPGRLSAGEGYLISLNPGSDGLVTFTGPLNGDFTRSLTSSSALNGWQAVGNPYTSAMEVVGATGGSSFLEVNKAKLDPSFAAIYVWNEGASYSGTQQYYKVIGNCNYNPPGIDAFAQLPDHSIQAGQGFLINIKDPSTPPSYPCTAEVSFLRTMQVQDTGLGLKSSPVSWHGITLLAQSHGQTRSTAVAFNDRMTRGLDVTYDAGLLASDYFQVYSHLVEGGNAVDFTIQCLPDDQYQQWVVPLGVDLPEGGELHWRASGVLLPEGLYPVLEDRVLGIKTALKTEADSYTVSLAKNTRGTGRFYLSVEGTLAGLLEAGLQEKYTASLQNNRLSINGAAVPGTKALLFDLCGRKVGEYHLLALSHNEILIPDSCQRVYLLKIEGHNYSQTLKLVAVNTPF